MASRRRVSVDFYAGQAVSSMQQTVETLHHLWDDVSMEDHQRISRVDGFYQILKNLMEDVIISERKMVESVHTSIEQWLKDVGEMRKELGMPVLDTSAFLPRSIALFKALEKERTRLSSLKEDRLNGQLHMIDELRTVAMRIGEELAELTENDSVELWDGPKMEVWQKKLEKYSRTLNERLDQAQQWRADMRRWTGQSNKMSVSEIEKAFVDVDLEDSERVFDEAFMASFREAHQLASEGYAEWVEQADFDYTEAVVKLVELWELCHVLEGERRFAPKFNPNVHTATDIQSLKSEVEKLQRFHEERAAVYNKLKEWKELWAEKLGFENHANDKSYYHNRGGQLQALLQRQKHIEHRLPLVLKELKKETEIYNQAHPDDPIMLDGLEPCEYAEFVMREYREQKEIERTRKKRAAGPSQTPERTLTPKKRAATPAFTTPSTASKVPRTLSQMRMRTPFNKVTGTPASRLRDFSMYGSTTSLNSVIAPVRPPVVGPKTSSPIDEAAKEQGARPPLSARKPVGLYKQTTYVLKNGNEEAGQRF